MNLVALEGYLGHHVTQRGAKGRNLLETHSKLERWPIHLFPDLSWHKLFLLSLSSIVYISWAPTSWAWG